MLADKDRIFTNVYGFQSWRLDAARMRGDWDDTKALLALGQELAQRPGPLVPLLVAAPGGRYPLEMLVLERSISTNLAAAGGNAALMAIG